MAGIDRRAAGTEGDWLTLGQAANGEMTGVYYCNVCECHLRDSANYLLHINGAKARPNHLSSPSPSPSP